MTPEEVTKEYARQITAAALDNNDYLVHHLLKEFGAKAYHAGRKDWLEMLAKREGWEVNRKGK